MASHSCHCVVRFLDPTVGGSGKHGIMEVVSLFLPPCVCVCVRVCRERERMMRLNCSVKVEEVYAEMGIITLLMWSYNSSGVGVDEDVRGGDEGENRDNGGSVKEAEVDGDTELALRTGNLGYWYWNSYYRTS